MKNLFSVLIFALILQGCTEAKAEITFGAAGQQASFPFGFDDDTTRSSVTLTDTTDNNGSGSTIVKRFASITTSGSDISCVDDSTVGSICTINETSIYCISYTASMSSANSPIMDFTSSSATPYAPPPLIIPGTPGTPAAPPNTLPRSNAEAVIHFPGSLCPAAPPVPPPPPPVVRQPLPEIPVASVKFPVASGAALNELLDHVQRLSAKGVHGSDQPLNFFPLYRTRAPRDPSLRDLHPDGRCDCRLIYDHY